ncbi:MAG: NUDIX domain-containing protein [Rhodobacteraceae bacterium]|nr:NUDIX domain-containing protein [Paracoccaceae bacterium]
MADFFFFGTLCHAPLLAEVLGRKAKSQPAQLADYAGFWAEGRAFPLLLAHPGAVTDGVLVTALTPHDIERLDFYQGGFARATQEVTVSTARGPLKARAYFAPPGQWQPGAPWALADWQSRFGPAVVATAREIMAQFKVRPAQTVMARYGQLLGRGAARVRAADTAPATLRRIPAKGDVQAVSRAEPYARFFSLEEQDLRFRRFDGEMSDPVNRAAFVSGDAVTVLPYDPRQDRVMLIEQFRFGPHVRGDANPWQLEAIAGRIVAGETPEDCARREAQEEAGLTLDRLLPIAGYYPSPGAMTEYLYCFLALVDLPDSAEGTFGLATEAEDIRAHVLSFDRFMQLCSSGEIGNGPALLSGLWLARERAALRG